MMHRRSLLLAAALLALPAPAWASACTGQIAYFHHLLAVVDRETADAVAGSRLLARYASVEVRTAKTAGQAAWTGRYIYGAHNYLELFGPGDSGDGSAVGSLGVAVGGDRAGVGDQVAARLAAAGVTPDTRSTKRSFGTRELDWFTTVRVKSENAARNSDLPGIRAWNVEFERDYLDAPEAERAPSEGPDDTVSRRRYLARSHNGAAFANISRIDLEMSAADYREKLAPIAQAAGFCRKAKANGVKLSGGEAEIRIRFVAPEHARLARVDFTLATSPTKAEREQIGRSQLKVGPGRSARWKFARSTQNP